MESKAGFSEELNNQAHGANRGAECSKCYKDMDRAKLEKHITEGTVMYCPDCGAPVKPKITFFGEGLPQKFMSILHNEDFADEVDLMIVMGTALAVGPFN